MSWFRLILAFLIAPLMTPLFFTVLSYAEGTVSLFNLWTLVAYVATLVFGIPAYFLYRALNRSHVALFVLGGAVIGFIVSLFILESIPLVYFIRSLEDRLWFAMAGALSALAFRMILFGLRFDRRRGSQLKAGGSNAVRSVQ